MITRRSSESIAMVVICLWLAGFLCWFSPQLLRGSLGLALLAGTLLGTVWTLLLDLRHGKSPIASLYDVVFLGSLAFAFPYSVIWCFNLLLAL